MPPPPLTDFPPTPTMRSSTVLLLACLALLCLSVVSASSPAQREKQGKYNARVGAKFLAEKAKEEGVTSLPSGVLYKVLTTGSGTKSPGPTDKVKVHYAGTLINGKEFDSSYARGSPAEFGVNGVIKGWSGQHSRNSSLAAQSCKSAHAEAAARQRRTVHTQDSSARRNRSCLQRRAAARERRTEGPRSKIFPHYPHRLCMSVLLLLLLFAAPLLYSLFPPRLHPLLRTEILQLMHPGDIWEVYIPSDKAYGPSGSGAKIGPNSTLVFKVELIDIVGAGGAGGAPKRPTPPPRKPPTAPKAKAAEEKDL